MLKSIKIENFRCFPFFEMEQLGRLNLIVGTNNSGKTSILEAIQLLLNLPANVGVLDNIILGRSEYIFNEENQERDLVIRHLFYDHKIDFGSQFSIRGVNDHNVPIEVVLSVEDIKTLNSDIESPTLCIKGANNITDIPFKLSKEGVLSSDLLQMQYFRKSLAEPNSNIQFVNSSSLDTQEAIELFDELVLTSEEDLVTQSLQIIEPRIKRIAIVSSVRFRYVGSRGGFVVQFFDENKRIPIGSMGDGMWRMLGLALAIVNAKNGVLLIDEIDTGLHFTVMSDMWRMLWETAKRLNVQIFATTHSNDCWQSLADIANAENPSEDGITIHRIEKGKPHSIVFTERQIAIAAERNIEVR
ncbi:ATP/GTP-binding protein [Pseudanabaena sp. BC1403]|uniref:AAA family ATPase n=1 Tax=Pseudanabaena sp. BC1403 TaxID=2043171 RepID=UPI000CD90129|nr:ATP-binding protein [Pseudanabaena sp. BC1403]